MDGLRVTVVKSGGRTDLSVSGDIDIATVDRFSRALRDAVFEASDAVALDLMDVPFMGSVGLSALIGARQLAVERGVTLRIVKASTNVEHVLELMALTDYFE